MEIMRLSILSKLFWIHSGGYSWLRNNNRGHREKQQLGEALFFSANFIETSNNPFFQDSRFPSALLNSKRFKVATAVFEKWGMVNWHHCEFHICLGGWTGRQPGFRYFPSPAQEIRLGMSEIAGNPAARIWNHASQT